MEMLPTQPSTDMTFQDSLSLFIPTSAERKQRKWESA